MFCFQSQIFLTKSPLSDIDGSWHFPICSFLIPELSRRPTYCRVSRICSTHQFSVLRNRFPVDRKSSPFKGPHNDHIDPWHFQRSGSILANRWSGETTVPKALPQWDVAVHQMLSAQMSQIRTKKLARDAPPDRERDKGGFCWGT